MKGAHYKIAADTSIENGVISPFRRYFGGKGGAGVYQTIINQIRPHDVYVEPFVGGGSIFEKKKPAAFNLINDLDPQVANLWKMQQLPEKTEVLNVDATTIINRYIHEIALRKEQHKTFGMPVPSVVFYLDPPYPIASRNDARERYRCEMTDQQHIDLLVKVNQLSMVADVLISTYPNEIYAQALRKWRKIEFQARTSRGTATEWLYVNYGEPVALHDTRYIGNNYRERERIKLKAQRWGRKFRALPQIEQYKIREELLKDPS